jgi:hypothetical protein
MITKTVYSVSVKRKPVSQFKSFMLWRLETQLQANKKLKELLIFKYSKMVISQF